MLYPGVMVRCIVDVAVSVCPLPVDRCDQSTAELQRTNSSPISNCQRSQSAILISCNINSNINSLLRLCVGTHIIYISDERYILEVEMKTI